MWQPDSKSLVLSNSDEVEFATVEVFTGSSKAIEWGSTKIEEFWFYIKVTDTSG